MTTTAVDDIRASGDDIRTSEKDFWLTAELRPAGSLAGTDVDRLVEDLTSLAHRANIVILSLVAATVPDPDAFARALREPGEMLSGPDRCLLLVGADPALLTALRRCGGDIATLAGAEAT